MYAHHLTVFVRNNLMDEALKLYEERVIPEKCEQKGYFGSYVLTDREASKIIVVSLWESKDEAFKYESDGIYKRHLDKFNYYLIEPPINEGYDVNIIFSKPR